MAWYYVLSLLSQAVEAFAGFGSSALAAPFLSLSLGTGTTVALLSLNSFLCNSFVLLRHDRKRVNWKAYWKLTGAVLLFLPIGLLVFSRLQDQEDMLKLILGLVILFVGGRYCYYAFIRKAEPRALSRASRIAVLAAGGVVHGIFSTGGPLLTLYMADTIQDKDEFRATMNAFWVTISSLLLLARLLLFDIYTPEIFKTVLLGLPCIAAGIALGLYLHKKVDNQAFKKVVYVVLLLGGMISVAFSLIKLYG